MQVIDELLVMSEVVGNINAIMKFFFISLTVDASRFIEAQMELPRLLFGVDFQIFIVTPQMYSIGMFEMFNLSICIV